MELSIRMGALSPTITEQLSGQGLPFELDIAERWNRSKKYIAFLSIQGLLSGSERRKAEQRLFKSIRSHIVAELKKSSTAA